MSWGNTSKTKLTQLYTKENKCLRSIFFAHSRENADPYYSLLEIMKLDNIFKFKMAILAFLIRNAPNTIPATFSDILTSASKIHDHNTRYAANENFYKPNIRTNFGDFTFKFSVTKIWQSIPTRLKHLPFNCFKKQYKSFLLENQKSNN